MSIFENSAAYRPFKYPKLVELAKKHSVDMHWTEQQVELQDDLRQYNAVGGLDTTNTSHSTNKQILDKVLCLFTELDKTVGEGYTKLLPYVKNNEARNWFLTAASREVIHQRAYALAAETFGFEESSWRDFEQYIEMVDKIDLMTISGDLSDPFNFAVELTRLLLSEGIGLFAAFSTLLNFKRHGLLIGFNDINQWSLLDENEHVIGNIFVLEEIRKVLTDGENEDLDRITDSFIECFVASEKAFIDLVFDIGDLEDLTKEDMKGYIDYLGNMRSHQLGRTPHWKVGENPLKWLEFMLVGKNHDNFFEKRVTDYSHAGLLGEVDYSIYKE